MDRDVAQHVLVVAWRASSDIGHLVPFLKEHCAKDEYEEMARAVASASYMITHEIVSKIYSQFPELEKEFEERVAKYGVVI